MDYFKLPHTTRVERAIPKNAFDAYTNTKQKKLFTDKVLRITWTNKLSRETLNLESKEIKEIQIFKIELKTKDDISSVLDTIDKAIPYHIIFVVEYGENIFLSTSAKHSHPANENLSVIDWNFRTSWFLPFEDRYKLNLTNNLYHVYLDFCHQLSGNTMITRKSIEGLVQHERDIDHLNKELTKLQKAIKNCKQFNKKVELNMKLKIVESQIIDLTTH